MARLILILWCLLVPAALAAQGAAPPTSSGTTAPARATPLDRAEALMREDRPAAALALIAGLTPATPEELRRHHWIMGVAQLRLDRPRAAIAPLDRLVALHPEETRYRLELATALVRAGQTERARYHLELALGADLAPRVQSAVADQIDRIDREKAWTGYLRVAVAPQTNAARRTAAEMIRLGNLSFALRPDARAQAATGLELGFGLGLRPRLSDDLRGDLGIDVFARTYGDTAPDDVTLRLRAALLQFGDSGRQVRAEAYVADRRLNGDTYSITRGVELRHARRFGARTTGVASIRGERLDYPDLRYDVHRVALSLWAERAVTQRIAVNAALRAEDRSSANGLAAGEAYGISLGGQMLFAGGLRAGLLVSHDRDSFDGMHPLFGVHRSDKRTTANLTLNNQGWSYAGFSPVLSVGWERQSSSIPVNDYRNLTASVSLTRSF